MATLNLRRFTKYETLTAIRPAHLLQLLDPYKDYFASRGAASARRNIPHPQPSPMPPSSRC